MDIVNTFIKVNKLKLPYKITDRREGDIPVVYCNPNKIKKKLDFNTKYNIEDMCKTSWNFIINNMSD